MSGGLDLSEDAAVALIGAETTILVSLLVVATFVEAILAGQRSETGGLEGLTAAFWGRRLANLLIVCAALSLVAIGTALAFVFWSGRLLEILTVSTFVAVLVAFSVASGSVLFRMARRGGGTYGDSRR